jgi:hypothetical protein
MEGVILFPLTKIIYKTDKISNRQAHKDRQEKRNLCVLSVLRG